MTLSIILLTYNSKDEITNCLKSLKNNYFENFQKNEFEIIVSDNASIDDTVEEVKKFIQKNPDINFHLIQNKENFGYAKGINNALEKVKGEYILILNPDTEVKNNGLIRMLDYAKEDEKAILGARLISPNGKIEKTAGKDFNLLHFFLLSLSLDKFFKMRFAPDKIQKVDWVAGTCLFLKKSLFQNIGGFDEKYFMYVEDADFCRRARNMGAQVLYFPEFEVMHESHASGSRDFAITNIYKGLVRYSGKFHVKFIQFLVQFLLTAKARVLMSFYKLLRKRKKYNTYLKALSQI